MRKGATGGPQGSVKVLPSIAHGPLSPVPSAAPAAGSLRQCLFLKQKYTFKTHILKGRHISIIAGRKVWFGGMSLLPFLEKANQNQLLRK